MTVLKNMMGLGEVDVEARVRDAVVKQLLIEIGAVLSPTRVGDGPEFKYKTIEEFHSDIYAMEGMGNPAARRMDQRDANQDRIKELQSKPKSKLTPEEEKELAELIQFESTVYGRDEDGNIRLTSGSSLLAGQLRSATHFDVHGDADRPTTLGVPYLQEIAFGMNDATIRMETFDAETQRGIASNVAAFRPEEVTPASLLHPEWVAKAENHKPVRTDPVTDQELAVSMGQRSQESIDAEIRAERQYADEEGLDVNGVRLTRLVRRLERQMENEIRYAKTYFTGDELEQRIKGIRKRFYQRSHHGWENTTGTDSQLKSQKTKCL